MALDVDAVVTGVVVTEDEVERLVVSAPVTPAPAPAPDLVVVIAGSVVVTPPAGAVVVTPEPGAVVVSEPG